MTFLERQFSHALYIRKEAEGRHRKRKLEEAAQAKKDADQGAHDFAGFKPTSGLTLSSGGFYLNV